MPVPEARRADVPTPTPTAPPAPTAIPTPVPDGRPNRDPHAGPDRRLQRPSGVQSIAFSKTKYPNIRRHAERAIRKGWPRVLVLNRAGADARRERLLHDWPTRPARTATSTRPPSAAAAEPA